MRKQLRRAVIAGNWKMNKTPEESRILIDELKPLIKDANCEVIVCPPYVDLNDVIEAAKGSNIKVGAQNCHWEPSGAYTAEISAYMLIDMGVQYVIIGHSERRLYFGETNETVNKRVIASLSSGLRVIICVGESLNEREQNITAETVSIQTKTALQNVSKEELKNVIIAYEPIWAIGTGKTATSKQAGEACKTIRETIADIYDRSSAETISIQYGGSMNAENADELLDQVDIDGGLIGGASLKAPDFSNIIKAASK